MPAHFPLLRKLIIIFSYTLLIVHESAGVQKQQRSSKLTQLEDDPTLFKEPQQFECESEGFHPNPNDCSIFHLCVDKSQTSLNANATDPLTPDSFISITFECNPGFFFDSKIDSCVNATKSSRGECLRDVTTSSPDTRFAGDESTPQPQTKKPTSTKKPFASKSTTTAKPPTKSTTVSVTPSTKNRAKNVESGKTSTTRAPLVSVSVQNGNDFANRINFAVDTSYPGQKEGSHAAAHPDNETATKSEHDDTDTDADKHNSSQATGKTKKPIIFIVPQPSQPHDDSATDSNQPTTTTSAPEKSNKSKTPVTKKPLVLVVRRKNSSHPNGTASSQTTPKINHITKIPPPVKRPSVTLEPPPPPVKRPSVTLEPPPPPVKRPSVTLEPPSLSENATVDDEQPIIYIIPPPGTLQNSVLFGSQPKNEQNEEETERPHDISETESPFKLHQDENIPDSDSVSQGSQYHPKYVPKPSIYLLPPTSLSPDEVATLSPPTPAWDGDYNPTGSGFEDTSDNLLNNSESSPQPTTYHPRWGNGSNRRNDRSSTPPSTLNEDDSYTPGSNVDAYSPLPEGQWQTPSIRLLPPTQFPSEAQNWETSTSSSDQTTKQVNYSQDRLDSRSNFDSQPYDVGYTSPNPTPAQFWRTFNPQSQYSHQPPTQVAKTQTTPRQSKLQPQWKPQPQQGGVTARTPKAYSTSKTTNSRRIPNGLESRSGFDSQWDDPAPSWPPQSEYGYTEAVSNQDVVPTAATPTDVYDQNIHYYTDANNGVPPQPLNVQPGGSNAEGDQLETSTLYYGYDPQQQAANTVTHGYDPQQQAANTVTYGYDPQQQAANTVTYGYDPQQHPVNTQQNAYYPSPQIIATTQGGYGPPRAGPCVEDGFFAIENDCSRFYRCVSMGAGFQKFTFSCGPGTVWDPNISACNHGWATHRQDCGSH